MITVVRGNKGGSSKTTTATNLAVALAIVHSKDVVLVDSDIQRSASCWHAEREASGLSPAITLIEKTGNISQTLRSLAEKYDHVIVDVSGRNSRELINSCTVAAMIIAPHQCSQLDLDTMFELLLQLIGILDLHPDLKASAYQSIATTNPILEGSERNEFLENIVEFDQLTPMTAKSCYRKIYRDVMLEGKSVMETDNGKARDEVMAFINEVF